MDFISYGDPQATDVLFPPRVSSGLHLRFELKLAYQ